MRIAAFISISAPFVVATAIAGDPTLSVQSDIDLCASQPGETIDVTLSMLDLGENEAAGFQAFLAFDETRLSFLGGVYTPAPFGLPILEPIIATGGEIDLAAGIDNLGGQQPTSEDALLVTLTFEVLPGEGRPALGFRDHDPPTRLTDLESRPIEPLVLAEFPPLPCPEDLDRSGAVDFADLLIILGAWGEECPGDLDGNGQVDFADTLRVLSTWGPCP